MRWPCAQKGGSRFLQPQAEDIPGGGCSVTPVAWSSACFFLLRVGLPPGSDFYDEGNSTWRPPQAGLRLEA